VRLQGEGVPDSARLSALSADVHAAAAAEHLDLCARTVGWPPVESSGVPGVSILAAVHFDSDLPMSHLFLSQEKS
jgi:hypothetical protein